MNIRAVSLNNIGPFNKETFIELSEISLLFGENSAGKSTILKAIKFLSKAISELNGDNTEIPNNIGDRSYTNFLDLVYGKKKSNYPEISVFYEKDEHLFFLSLKIGFPDIVIKDYDEEEEGNYAGRAEKCHILRIELYDITNDDGNSVLSSIKTNVQKGEDLREGIYGDLIFKHSTHDDEIVLVIDEYPDSTNELSIWDKYSKILDEIYKLSKKEELSDGSFEALYEVYDFHVECQTSVSFDSFSFYKTRYENDYRLQSAEVLKDRLSTVRDADKGGFWETLDKLFESLSKEVSPCKVSTEINKYFSKSGNGSFEFQSSMARERKEIYSTNLLYLFTKAITASKFQFIKAKKPFGTFEAPLNSGKRRRLKNEEDRKYVLFDLIRKTIELEIQDVFSCLDESIYFPGDKIIANQETNVGDNIFTWLGVNGVETDKEKDSVLNEFNGLINELGLEYEFKQEAGQFDETLKKLENSTAYDELRLVFQKHHLSSYIKLIDKTSSTSVNLTQVGSGVSQVLPILLALSAKKNTLFLISQPELHLHPGQQAKLAEIIVKSAIVDKNRFLLETHSEHIIKRIQVEVARFSSLGVGLSKKQVSVNYAHRNHEYGGARLKKIDLDDNGNFVEPWPDNFFDSSSDLTYERLKLIGSRQN